mgnify:CR=1 FL=1
MAYARTIIPIGTRRFVIKFKQWCHDYDYIGFVLGASQPLIEHDGVEFGYQRQRPGTDTTVEDIYYRGDFGEGMIPGKALMRRWVGHRIECDGTNVRWYQNNHLMLEGDAQRDLSGGYFGIRQRYERDTRYDDARIVIEEEDRPKRPNFLFIAIDDL